MLCSAVLGYLAYTASNKDQLSVKAEKIVDSTDSFPKSYPILKRTSLKAWKIDKKLFLFGSRVVALIRRQKAASVRNSRNAYCLELFET